MYRPGPLRLPLSLRFTRCWGRQERGDLMLLLLRSCKVFDEPPPPLRVRRHIVVVVRGHGSGRGGGTAHHRGDPACVGSIGHVGNSFSNSKNMRKREVGKKINTRSVPFPIPTHAVLTHSCDRTGRANFGLHRGRGRRERKRVVQLYTMLETRVASFLTLFFSPRLTIVRRMHTCAWARHDTETGCMRFRQP